MRYSTNKVTTSTSAVVSISYSDYSGSSSYVYDYLTYSGDRNGSSTGQSYSQSYTKDSKPLTVTFYCHEKVTTPTSGSITVRAIDGDTDALISYATAKLGSTTGSGNPASFTGVSFGTHTASASASGYSSASESVKISASQPNKTVTLRLYKSSGDVTVIVRDSSNRETISGASVSGAGQSGTTNSSGRVSFSGISFGTYLFSASKTGYSSGSASATISASSTSTTITIYLDPLPRSGDITVLVKDRNTGNPIRSASVTGSGRSRTTGTDGRTTFTDLPFGSYTFTASKAGYYDNSAIEGKLFLRVNREKTKVADIGRIKFLGYGFRYSKDGIKVTVHKKSKEKLKAKVKEITKRSDGRGYEWKKQRLKYLVRGWVNYFKLADMKTFLTETDERRLVSDQLLKFALCANLRWMRTRLRTYIWKSWKTIKNRCRNLRKLGASE